MKRFSLLMLLGLALGAPTSDNKDEKLIITSQLSIYKAGYGIVNLYFPVDYNEDSNTYSNEDEEDIQSFFVLGDKTGNKIDYKGLYMSADNNKVTKILDNGVDMTTPRKDRHTVYIGATDGIYKYDIKKNTTEKYGSLTDSIINIAKPNKDDLIYILTEDKILYKVTDGGNTKTIMDNVKDAQQIVLDSSDNIYYYDSNNKIYIVNEQGVKEVAGLPESVTEITLFRPPFVFENSIPAVINDEAYNIKSDGTLEISDLTLRGKPTADCVEGTLLQYWVIVKNILLTLSEP